MGSLHPDYDEDLSKNKFGTNDKLIATFDHYLQRLFNEQNLKYYDFAISIHTCMYNTLAKAPQIYTYDDVHAMVAEAW